MSEAPARQACAKCGARYRARLVRFTCPVCREPAPGAPAAAGRLWRVSPETVALVLLGAGQITVMVAVLTWIRRGG